MEATQPNTAGASWCYHPRMRRALGEVALALVLSLGCGGSLAFEDPSASRGAGGTGSGGGSGGGGFSATCEIPPQSDFLRTNRVVGTCPMLRPACQETPFEGTPLLNAADLGAEVGFVATSNAVVLAERRRPDGTMEPLVVSVPDFFGSEPFAILPFATPLPAGTRPRDIDGRTILLCAPEGCRLYVGRKDGTIEELAGAHPLPEAEPAGVADWKAAGMHCIYGNGVHCFDLDHWIDVVPAESGPRFNAAAAVTTAIWAAGDAGRLVIATPECWLELESGTKSTLRSLSADTRDLWATAVGDDGVVAHVTLDETTTCNIGGVPWTTMHRTWGNGNMYDLLWLFQEDGQGVHGKPSDGGEWCTTDIGATVLEVTNAACWADNWRVLTPTSLYGAPLWCPLK